MVNIKDIDEQIKLIFDIFPSYLQKYGCNVQIVKKERETKILISANMREFEIIFKETTEEL